MQNRINLSLINLIAAMKYGAFRQRFAAGLEVDEDPITGQKIQPYKLDIKSLWTSGDPETKFGEFAATDLVPYVRAVEAGVQDLAALTRTPPHYLIGAVVNVSGDALSAAETGLVSKVRDRNRNFGESWEQTMRLAFRVLDDKQRAEAWSAETLWADPEFRSVSEMADAAVKRAPRASRGVSAWSTCGTPRARSRAWRWIVRPTLLMRRRRTVRSHHSSRTAELRRNGTLGR